jgi:SAM-dependent methyltransferase
MNTLLLGEPAGILRLKFITDAIDSFNLPEKSKILDIGGNNFAKFCQQKKFEYTCIDLCKPQDYGTGGYFGGDITYNGRDLPFKCNSFDVIIISFVLHHAGSDTFHLLNQIKDITKNYIIICEDLNANNYPITWHKRCFTHQNNGLFRSDEEWKYIFSFFRLNLLSQLNIRCNRDKEFSDPYDYIYRVQYNLQKII